MRSRRRCSGLAKSETLRGRSSGRQGEFGASHQPVRKVIALAVIEQTLYREFLQLMFQFGQVLRASHFEQIRQAKYKVAKAKFLGKNSPQILQ